MGSRNGAVGWVIHEALHSRLGGSGASGVDWPFKAQGFESMTTATIGERNRNGRMASTYLDSVQQLI